MSAPRAIRKRQARPLIGSFLQQFALFAAIGALGFAVDAAIFLLMISAHFDWPISWARTLSAFCSITTTWALNRHTTFANQKSRDAKGEYTRYLLVQSIGLGINLGVFVLCLTSIPKLRAYPVLALALGAAAALLVNFFTARAIAFRRDLAG